MQLNSEQFEVDNVPDNFIKSVNSYKRKVIFGIDFDGTICAKNYPEIGEVYPIAIYVINALLKAGHYVFLNTLRSGVDLENAFIALAEAGVDVTKLATAHSAKAKWNFPNASDYKVFADFYIDDMDLNSEVDSEGNLYWYGVVSKLCRVEYINKRLLDLF